MLEKKEIKKKLMDFDYCEEYLMIIKKKKKKKKKDQGEKLIQTFIFIRASYR